MIDWADLAKVWLGGVVALGGFFLKDYWQQRTGPSTSPTLEWCSRQHEEHARIHDNSLVERKAMRQATIKILLMMQPICEELLKNTPRYEHISCDDLHKCIVALSE